MDASSCDVGLRVLRPLDRSIDSCPPTQCAPIPHRQESQSSCQAIASGTEARVRSQSSARARAYIHASSTKRARTQAAALQHYISSHGDRLQEVPLRVGRGHGQHRAAQAHQALLRCVITAVRACAGWYTRTDPPHIYTLPVCTYIHAGMHAFTHRTCLGWSPYPITNWPADPPPPLHHDRPASRPEQGDARGGRGDAPGGP